jgi:hypothetical protein
MSYVIYHKETTKIVSKKGQYSPYTGYATEAAAKAAMTRMSNQDRSFNPKLHAIAEVSYFKDNIEKKETRHGIAGSDGKEFEVGVNTPWTSGPWSETYWSA